VVGTGPDTAVFVHESGTQGLCGFWPYADWLASAEGVRSVLFNQCTYGASQCAAIDEAEEWIAATEAAVAWARDHDARRVTIDEMQSVCIKLPRPPPNSWSRCPTERATAGKCSPTPAVRLVTAGDDYRQLDTWWVVAACRSAPTSLTIVVRPAGCCECARFGA
jgi:hypothetical protein